MSIQGNITPFKKGFFLKKEWKVPLLVRPLGHTREHLFWLLGWMRTCPHNRTAGNLNVRAPGARRAHKGKVLKVVYELLERLASTMVEVNPCHLRHPNNAVPHFHPSVVGAWDTFPVQTLAGDRRYQPKYQCHCVKFNAVLTFQGLFAYLSGPHPGAESDTTLARTFRPGFLPHESLLGDKAYISVPNCVVPIKERPGGLSPAEVEYNRVHQFYRARVEHAFAWVNKWKVVSGCFRGHDLHPLQHAVRIICGIRNIMVCVRLPYPPHRAQ